MSEAAQNLQPPHGLKGLVDAPPAAVPWGSIVLGVLVLAALAYVLWRIYQRYRRQPEAVAPVVAAPTPVITVSPMQRLASLRVPDSFDRQAQQQFSFEISQILRSGLSKATGRDAVEQTTQEIESYLPRVWRWRDELRPQLVGLLRDMDAVKFAGRPLEKERAQTLLGDTKEWLSRMGAQ